MIMVIVMICKIGILIVTMQLACGCSEEETRGAE